MDLIKASSDGNLDLVKLLLERGANVNSQNNIFYGQTALIRASENGHTEIVKLLSTNGADVNIQDIYGQTALILSSLRGHLEVIKLLLEKGADPFDKNNKNKYPLDLCENEKCKKIISKSMWDIMYGNVKIKVNSCLLYTSPSPRD